MIAEAKDENAFNWNDGKYHWYEFEFTNETRKIEYREDFVESPGKLFKLSFDGEEKLSYFQPDKYVMATSTGAITDVPFSTTSGYIGFWPSSDFPIGANTDATNCFVDVKKVQITSYDNDNTTPYEICEAPDFDIESETFSPASSYDAGEEIEIRLSNLFSYEGDEELTYTVTCNGSSIGNITNGYWVWTPEEAGTYNVDFKAEAGGKSALNYVTLRVKAATLPPPARA